MTSSWSRAPWSALAIPALLLPACEAPEPQNEAAPEGQVTERVHEGAAEPAEGVPFAEAQEAGRAELTFFFVPSSGFAYRDEEGHLTGVTVELLRDFARWTARAHDLEVEVTWVEEEEWADFYGYVRDSRGAAFGIGNVTITEERWEELDFSPPYLSNVAVLATHEDVPELESLEEANDALGHLTALLYPGTLHEERLRDLTDRYAPEAAFDTVRSNDQLVSALSDGPTAFGYIDIYNYWRAREAGAPLRRHPVGDDSDEEFGIILPDGSDWTPVMEEYFRQRNGVVGTEEYRALLEEHLGGELAGLLSERAGTDAPETGDESSTRDESNGAAGIPEEQQAFWEALEGLCGGAFPGKLIDAPTDDDWWEAERVVMHVRECHDDEIRIPLHIDDDRSRTWVVTRTDAGLQLKHDHRLEDGTPDEANTDYGGHTEDAGSRWRQTFPADDYSVGEVPGRATQFWYLELRPEQDFVYGLLRQETGLHYRVVFDLATPVEEPPPPW